MKTILNQIAIRYLKSHALNKQAASVGRYEGWKKVTFYVAFPAVCLGMLLAFVFPPEKHHERAPFVPYEYMRVRTKRFPWGDGQKSLFHNSNVNALPSGYEEH